MKVRMKFQIQGTRNGLRWPDAGGEVDLPADEAVHLCEAGYAEPVAVDPEKATARKAEKRA